LSAAITTEGDNYKQKQLKLPLWSESLVPLGSCQAVLGARAKGL